MAVPQQKQEELITMTYHVGAARRRGLRQLLDKAIEVNPSITYREYDVTLGASSYEVAAPKDVIEVLNKHLRPMVKEGVEVSDDELFL